MLIKVSHVSYLLLAWQRRSYVYMPRNGTVSVVLSHCGKNCQRWSSAPYRERNEEIAHILATQAAFPSAFVDIAATTTQIIDHDDRERATGLKVSDLPQEDRQRRLHELDSLIFSAIKDEISFYTLAKSSSKSLLDFISCVLKTVPRILVRRVFLHQFITTILMKHLKKQYQQAKRQLACNTKTSKGSLPILG